MLSTFFLPACTSEVSLCHVLSNKYIQSYCAVCVVDARHAWVFVASQGIKFYDPEIVENTPEAVEYRGLQNVMDVVAEQLGYEQGKVSQVG